ncbi:unnamed protein product, partial [Effrenium voratum]
VASKTEEISSVSSEGLWLLEYENGELIMSRAVHPYERLTAQGFPAHLGDYFNSNSEAVGALITLMVEEGL